MLHSFTLDMSPERQAKQKQQRNCLLATVVFLLIAVLTFGVLFGVFYGKYKDCDDKSAAMEVNPPFCLSPDCVATASYLYSVMDLKADPCVDFSQYVCGRMINETIIPSTESQVDVFQDIERRSEKFFRNLLEEPISVDDRDYLRKMKDYYASCLDTETIEKIGLTPYSDSNWIEDWPTLNPSWNSSTFDLIAATQRYETEFLHSFFSYYSHLDYKNSSRKMLFMGQPSLCLSVNEMRGARNSSAILACEQFYVDVATALKANSTVARDDARALVDFQIQMANISVRYEDVNNNSDFINPSTFKQMNKDYPYIDWVRTFEAIFNRSGMEFDPEMIVNLEAPIYFESLRKIIENADPRVLQNMYAYDNAYNRLRKLTVAMRSADLEWRKQRYGVTEEEPRWRQCVKAVGDHFGAGLSKQFVNKFFSQDSKDFVTKMVLVIKETFKEQIEASSWMDAKTKEAAFLKLRLMKQGIGFPDKKFAEKDIEDAYKQVTVNTSNFYQSRLELITWSGINAVRKLEEAPNNDDWQDSAKNVNAYSRFGANAINLYAGILQAPFYSATFPSSLNYGAIGNIIGHELSHAFDLRGSQYDEKGNLRNWWTADDRKKFSNRTQCLIDQYSKIFIKEVGLYMNGRRSVQENAGDTGGDISAYKAYKKFAATQPNELPLPGLGLTTDQQVFVGVAQGHCAKYREMELKSRVLSGTHPPGFVRINVPLQNNEDFAKVFDCPQGSPMNPKRKCVIW